MNFDLIAENYHHITTDFMTADRFNFELKSYIHSLQPDNWHMIDIGCGSGLHCHFFCDKFSGIQKMVGIDKSDSLLKLARQNYIDPRLVFIKSDFHDMPFDDNTFDFVHSRLALHYSTNMLEAFKEIARITKPGGGLYIYVVHPIYELFIKPSSDYRNPEKAIFPALMRSGMNVEHATHTVSEYINAISCAALKIRLMSEEYGSRSTTELGYKIPTKLIFHLQKPL